MATFVRETGREIGTWEDAPRRFKVCLGEPMTESDQAHANESLSAVEIGVGDTHSSQNGNALLGANDTHSSAADPNLIGASDIHREDQSAYLIGAIDTHNGAPDIHKTGASGIHDGAVDTHKNGASDTPDWRDWHSLNTLALGLNHKKNTPTTTDADIEPDLEVSVRQTREGGGGHGMEFIGFARTKPNKRQKPGIAPGKRFDSSGFCFLAALRRKHGREWHP